MSRPMPLHTRVLEVLIQVLIFYSIATHFIEIEFFETDHSFGFFLWSERFVAIVFTIEYFVRWVASGKWGWPLRLMAVADLLAILPFYLGFMVDMRSLRLIRTLRVLRVFKLYRYNAAMQHLIRAFWRVRHEFAVIGFALAVVVWCGALAVHEIERTAQPQAFGKMTDALWYVIVTVTTVGYGDKVPLTQAGRVAATCVMLSGLMLFGTFISLIGSAFVEEVRASLVKRQRAGCEPIDLSPAAGLADRVSAIAPQLGLDPGQFVRMVLLAQLPSYERGSTSELAAPPER